MELVNKIASLIIWLVYTYLEGMREAYYYYMSAIFNLPIKNIHWIYFVQRGLVLVLTGILTRGIFLPLSFACIFPFIHDGSYYITYNKLVPAVYKEKFKSSSTTSTAFFEFNWTKRIVLLILGIMFFAIDIVLYFF